MHHLIDHTYLKPEGTLKDIDHLIDEAIQYGFKSVCIQPVFVRHAAAKLALEDVLVCTVIGFPLGANTTETKVFETRNAIANGADEIDMVAHISALQTHQFDAFKDEVTQVKNACGHVLLKVILETAMLDINTIKHASEQAFAAGADFVKTSTGFGPGGATAEAVRAMKSVPNAKEVKASGGIRTYDDAVHMVEAGATRLGTSNGVAIVTGRTAKQSY